jgi:hypothetical protein
MFSRSISDECVEHIIQNSEVVEDYPYAFPFPAKLLLGWCNDRPIHVVAAEDRIKHLTIVITTCQGPHAEMQGLEKRLAQGNLLTSGLCPVSDSQKR